jgi:hypothetical protein
LIRNRLDKVIRKLSKVSIYDLLRIEVKFGIIVYDENLVVMMMKITSSIYNIHGWSYFIIMLILNLLCQGEFSKNLIKIISINYFNKLN